MTIRSIAARCKAWVCDLSLVGTAGSNPTAGMDKLSLERVECCKRSCDWPILHPEKYYRHIECVCLCVGH
jgi:hypothetical protein